MAEGGVVVLAAGKFLLLHAIKVALCVKRVYDYYIMHFLCVGGLLIVQKRPSAPQQPPRRPSAPPYTNSGGSYRHYGAGPQAGAPTQGRYAAGQGASSRGGNVPPRPAQGSYPPPRRPVQQPAQRPPLPEKTSYLARRRPSRLIPVTAACAALVAAGCLMQYVLYPGGWLGNQTARANESVTEIVSSRGVILSEVMTSNKTALSDETNAYPDWIELSNNGKKAVDVSGWTLTDKLSRTNGFTFPEGTLIAPGEYVIVYASGRLQNEAGRNYHAPFKLSSAGDSVILCDESGTVVESINLPAMYGDYSFARREGNVWEVTSEYTPGMENTSLAYAMLTTLEPVDNSPLVISEVVASNASFVPAQDGQYYDWIELYNGSAEAIDLTGYGLSDSADKPSRWRFPAATIAPGEYLIVYASGLDRSGEGEYHTNFCLRAEGESVLLYNEKGQLLDHVSYDNLKADQSYAREGDGFRLSTSPTPGKANS